MLPRFLNLIFSIRPDFVQFYEAGKMVNLGLNPYEKLLTSHGPFNYPPAILPIFQIFSLLPLEISAIIFNFLSVIALILSVYLLFKIIKWKPLWWQILIFYLLIFLSFPVKYTLGMGQINHFILLFICAGLYFYFKKQPMTGGILFSLASSFKLSPFLIGLYLLYKKEWRTLKWMILGTIILFFLPFLFLSFSFQKIYYTEILFRAFSGGGKEVYYNQALSGFISREFGEKKQINIPFVIPGLTRNLYKQSLLLRNRFQIKSGMTIVKSQFLTFILSIFLFFLTFWRLKKVSLFKQWSATISLMVLINALSWQHHLVFLIPCFFLLWGNLKKEKDFLRIFLLLVAYFLLAINLKNPSVYPQIFLSHGFFGTILLWGLSII